MVRNNCCWKFQTIFKICVVVSWWDKFFLETICSSSIFTWVADGTRMWIICSDILSNIIDLKKLTDPSPSYCKELPKSRPHTNFNDIVVKIICAPGVWDKYMSHKVAAPTQLGVIHHDRCGCGGESPSQCWCSDARSMLWTTPLLHHSIASSTSIAKVLWHRGRCPQPAARRRIKVLAGS